MEWQHIQEFCGRIPPHSSVNCFQQYGTPINLFLDGDQCNLKETEIFPRSKYAIAIYKGEKYPPCFYVYCGRTSMAVSMETGKIVAIKRKGRNPKIVKHVAKNMLRWLKRMSKTYQTDISNWENVQDTWHYRNLFFYKGRMVTCEEYNNLPEIKEANEEWEKLHAGENLDDDTILTWDECIRELKEQHPRSTEDYSSFERYYLQ